MGSSVCIEHTTQVVYFSFPIYLKKRNIIEGKQWALLYYYYYLDGGRGGKQVLKGCFLSLLAPLSSIYVFNILKKLSDEKIKVPNRAKMVETKKQFGVGTVSLQLLFDFILSSSSSFLV